MNPIVLTLSILGLALAIGALIWKSPSRRLTTQLSTPDVSPLSCEVRGIVQSMTSTPQEWAKGRKRWDPTHYIHATSKLQVLWDDCDHAFNGGKAWEYVSIAAFTLTPTEQQAIYGVLHCVDQWLIDEAARQLRAKQAPKLAVFATLGCPAVAPLEQPSVPVATGANTLATFTSITIT